MKRTTNRESKLPEGHIKWRKDGGGHFHLPGRIIKPGQIFTAHPDDIPLAFRDTVVPLSKLPEEKAPDVAAAKYKLKHRSGKWYDVVDAQGKVMNEKAMDRPDALKLIRDLE